MNMGAPLCKEGPLNLLLLLQKLPVLLLLLFLPTPLARPCCKQEISSEFVYFGFVFMRSFAVTSAFAAAASAATAAAAAGVCCFL